MGFLRALFGPSRDEVWREIADQLDGQFIKDSSFWTNETKVRVEVQDWVITLDSYTKSNGDKSSTSYTRFRAPFCNADDFRFQIYRTHLFSPVGRMLGIQDINIGDKFFDDEFVIKGNNVAMVQAFFANPGLRQLIHQQPSIHLRIEEDTGWFGSSLPDGVDELIFTRTGIMKNIAELRGVFELFAASLHQLCHIGAAYEDDPDFYY